MYVVALFGDLLTRCGVHEAVLPLVLAVRAVALAVAEEARRNAAAAAEQGAAAALNAATLVGAAERNSPGRAGVGVTTPRLGCFYHRLKAKVDSTRAIYLS